MSSTGPSASTDFGFSICWARIVTANRFHGPLYRLGAGSVQRVLEGLKPAPAKGTQGLKTHPAGLGHPRRVASVHKGPTYREVN